MRCEEIESISAVSPNIAQKKEDNAKKRNISVDKKEVSVSVEQKPNVNTQDSNDKKHSKPNRTIGKGCKECLNGNTCMILHRVVTCYGQIERCEKDQKIQIKTEQIDDSALNHKIIPKKYAHNTGDPSNIDN